MQTPPAETARHAALRAGFTLIELSIVLVVIGLIVGGVLVGKDLIKAAQVRAQVSQLQRFDTAVTTFRLKYGYLPGDISNAHTIAFGLASQNWQGSCGCMTVGGNEDGIIEDGGYPITYIQDEAYLFFINLAKAKLINDLSGNLDYPYGVTGCFSLPNYHQYIGCQYPAAKIGSGGFTVTSLPDGSLAYFLGMTATDANASFNNYTVAGGSDGLGVVTPADAYSLDTKIDDGMPLSGKLQASQYPATPETRSNYCLTSVASNTYNITNTNIACNLLIQSSAR